MQKTTKIALEKSLLTDELINLCSNCYYDSIKYISDYKKWKDEINLHPEFYKKHKSRIHRKSECQIAWGDFYREAIPLLEKEESIGNIVSISSKLKENIETITKTIEVIKKNNLVPYDKINGSDYLIVFDEDDKERLLSNFKYLYKGQIILYKDFIKRK